MICLNSAGSPARSQVDDGRDAPQCTLSTQRRHPREGEAPQADGFLPSPACTGQAACRSPSLKAAIHLGDEPYQLNAACPGEATSDRPAGSALETTEVRSAVTPTSLRRPTRTAKKSRAIARKPTLRRTWSGESSRPQCAFEVSMIYVFCNSH